MGSRLRLRVLAKTQAVPVRPRTARGALRYTLLSGYSGSTRLCMLETSELHLKSTATASQMWLTSAGLSLRTFLEHAQEPQVQHGCHSL